eukprot:1765480-Prymnesium_polylepis.1
MYVPVDAHRRGSFLNRLRAGKLLTRSTIVRMDANCVQDVSLDVLHSEGSRTHYSNTHASTLEHIVSGLGLRDVF